VLKIVANLGYRSIYWTLDSLDGVEPVKTPEFLIDRITSRSDAELDGAIILLHVGVSQHSRDTTCNNLEPSSTRIPGS
jgi:peptidoglycan/xylan/chitin deacetylase (PgdA/CDA1 family)